MKKRLYKIIFAALIAVMIFSLASCITKIPGGDSSADVIGNGSLVVQQGEYIYFVNGKTTLTADNKSGNVVKGAIMRSKIDSDGNIVGGLETIIPQAFFTDYADGGLYIFGEWIYYVTPNPSKDKNGNVLSSQTLVMRTKIDGTKTKKIATIKSASVKYKVTENYFIYLDGTDLKAIDLKKNNFKITTVDTGVANFLVPKAPYYSKNGFPDIWNYVVYTKNSGETKTGYTHNEIKATNGKDIKTLVSDNAYFIDKTSWFGADDLKYRVYNYTPVSAKFDGANLIVYANRQHLDTAGNNAEGLFVYTFAEGNYSFNRDTVKYIASAAQTVFVPVAGGILVSENSTVLYYSGDLERNAYHEGAKDTLPKPVKVYGGAATLLSVKSMGEDGRYNVIFHNGSGKLCAVKINIYNGAIADEKGEYSSFAPEDKVKVLIMSGFDGTWNAPIFRTHGKIEYLYFIYNNNYDYLHRIVLTGEEGYLPAEDWEDSVLQRLGKFSGDDQTAYDAREKEENK
ncbi:MAG: DUF5050 domain-containing protein [Clostridiales bacterium]|jgi:hypothetical protein|nr:DUF5050 domain-containing protein [Clostridiales bacterium]